MNKFFKILTGVVMSLGLIVAVYNKMTWPDSVHNPDNWEFVVETAWNLNKSPYQISQSEFNRRYNTKRILP